MFSWKLLLLGLVVHLILFYSIFDIYFKSPIVHGMTPHSSPTSPPAKRLVLFVADGLRADKFYELQDGKSRSPFIRSIMEKNGSFGISHTRVPTESRPGHVAIIAGFYEDVSSIAKGWKENPVEFDSVFNESFSTWCWGSPDILPIFAKGDSYKHIYMTMYAEEEIDFGGTDPSRLDTYVFSSVKNFFHQAKQDPDLMKKLMSDKIVFFLHLLGIDTNGHSHHPHSKEYIENIQIVDEGIKEMVHVIDNFYNNDGKTAYILTSDHGMTNWGSHGAGNPHETLTPLVAWGAGIRTAMPAGKHSGFTDNFSEDWFLSHLLRNDVEQADIAPLMSSLIGVPFPMNSVGKLPLEYLSGDLGYKAENLLTNAKQILAQYTVKMMLAQNTSLSMTFKPFSELTSSIQAEKIQHIQNLIYAGQYEEAIVEGKRLIDLSLKGLQYYQTYNRMLLGTSVFFSFVGWMFFVICLLLQKHSGLMTTSFQMHIMNLRWWPMKNFIDISILVIICVIIGFLFVTSSPLMYYMYLLLPVLMWRSVIHRKDIVFAAVKAAYENHILHSVGLELIVTFIGLEILVYSFFERKAIAIGLILMALWAPLSFNWHYNKLPILGWVISCLALAVFPLLPTVNKDRNYKLVVAAGVIAIFLGSYSLHKMFPRESLMKTRKFGLFQVFLIGLAVYIVHSTANNLAVNQGLQPINQCISWLLLGSTFVLPLFSSQLVIERLHSILLSLYTLYTLMSTSHECLFILSFCCSLFFWVWLESIVTPSLHFQLDDVRTLHFGSELQEENNYIRISKEDTRRAYFFIFFMYTAFFGTGNIASINSFDPASVYCFLTVFHPFSMGTLLLLKVALPFFIVICALDTLCISTNTSKSILFLNVLIISDVMGLQFFFLVQDFGSWLEIGSSISHYVIAMTTIIFILLLDVICHCFTTLHIPLTTFKTA
ncbi:GPI ethanolamine phosphate transferase 1-like [Octopus sinensis]|uniref:GPI ethanolamine phosphate transferase 1 n=1 Tax=Octopus sinensis TaxID=2607531 RepID=A0A6P7TB10_9MOLL|nr:GPI ethanolamine phosphate transferase 1-like [Octopus sinensis]